MASGTTFGMYHKTFLVEDRTVNFEQDLFVSNLVRESGLATCKWHVNLTKFVLRNPISSEYFEGSAASSFGVIHIKYLILGSCLGSDAALLIKTASAYL